MAGALADSTIFALASGQGQAGVAVIRVSGPQSGSFAQSVLKKEPTPRQAHLLSIHDPKSGETLDQGLLLWFPGPNSYTGEDVLELHVHGGRAVVADILQLLDGQPGFRLADPGEFTRRAFQNGKMDLTQAEAVADLIAAETSVQRRQALTQLGGQLKDLYEDWRRRLIALSAHLEAEIDFSDEDLPEDLWLDITRSMNSLISDLANHLNDKGRAERVRQGLEVVILGAPNAGKSSLLNTLAKRDVAIVSAEAGTTRDMLDVHLDLAGYPVTLVDTAGLRETENAVEAEGVRRAKDRGAGADLRLLLIDHASDVSDAVAIDPDPDTLLILTKSDLPQGTAGEVYKQRAAGAISVTEDTGVSWLIDRITDEIAVRYDGVAATSLTRSRHRAATERCLDALKGALLHDDVALIAEDLRYAAIQLGRITGRVDVEDLLDVVFRDFCIGK